MPCLFCGKALAVSGDTGGSPEILGSAELNLLESFTALKSGIYDGKEYVLRDVNLPEFYPRDAHNMAVSCFAQYPDGVIVIRLGLTCAFLFTVANCQLVHISCAVEQLRLHRSIGAVVGSKSRVFALQVGRRTVPLVELMQ